MLSNEKVAAVDANVFHLVKADLKVEQLLLLGDDLDQRDRLGWETYGSKMQAHDGRDALLDAYEEALDLMAYLRKGMVERGPSGLLGLYRFAIEIACELKERLK